MTAMKISLSTQNAPEIWGKNAILSANDAGFTVHNPNNDLATIQKAARKIKNQGISTVELTGDSWDLESCWAFHQGFHSVKNQGSVQYPDLDEQQAEFDNRVKCATFVRELINKPSDKLTPEKLAEQAVEFIKKWQNRIRFLTRSFVAKHYKNKAITAFGQLEKALPIRLHS